MANEEHLAILKQGVEVWNQWKKENSDVKVDLGGANLQGANLQGADLGWVYLRSADLSRADLTWADLSDATLVEADLSSAQLSSANLGGANLSEANLSGTNLRGADLTGAYLTGADLSSAHLGGADLSSAKLTGADLTGADLTWADLTWAGLNGADLGQVRMAHTRIGDVDLSTVKGLETVRHEGPSTIGTDTIYRSQGKIPEVFLRGAGVPDNFITYMHSLTGEAIQYYTCFISYSTKDQDFAHQLHADLQAKGVRCWFAPEDIAGGKKLHEQIDQAIRVYDKLLVILSEHSMESEWVKTEIYNARQQEAAEHCRKLFPLSLVAFDAIRHWKAFDADRGKDMAREVREYFIPDFSHWKEHDAYQKAFNRLLRDLKQSEQQK